MGFLRRMILRAKISRQKATYQCPFCNEIDSLQQTGYESGGYHNAYTKRFTETYRTVTLQCMNCGASYTKRMQPRGRAIDYQEDDEQKAQFEHQLEMEKGG